MERLGDYDVIGRIGTGGSADLLLAVKGGKRVVLKRLHPHLAEDEAYVRMFAAEARVMSVLHHEGIVHGGEVEEIDDAVFFAMDLVDGPSLAAVQRLWKGPMPIDFAVAVAMHVAEALAYVHAATSNGEPLSLVHRDVAAPNILLSRDGDVKLTDFGVVKLPKKSSSFLTSASTSGGVLKGHLGTMAPEALRGAPVDARADIYSLAVVLWEAIEGRRMFEGTPLELVEKIVNDPIPALTRTEIDPDLHALLASMLAKDPALRPLSADVVAAALRSFNPASRSRVAQLVRSLGVPSLAI